jgi:hypothetical protein
VEIESRYAIMILPASTHSGRALYLYTKSPDYREQSKPVAGKKLQAKDMRVITLMRSPMLGGENTGLLNFESAKDLAKLHAIPDTTTEDLGCRDLHAKMKNRMQRAATVGERAPRR